MADIPSASAVTLVFASVSIPAMAVSTAIMSAIHHLTLKGFGFSFFIYLVLLVGTALVGYYRHWGEVG